MSFANAGKSWNRAELRAYLATLKRQDWIKGVTFHHTAEPALSYKAWANGWNPTLIANMRDGYQRNKGWASGPHFYPDDYRIWGLTPPTEKGVHAVSFNGSHIGIEVLGDFDTESHTSGRGAKCWLHAFECAAEVLTWAGLTAEKFNFHRDDPKTQKTCPGKNIDRLWVQTGIIDALRYVAEPVKPQQRMFVPIASWLSVHGIKSKVTKNASGQVIVNGCWIESAYYDKDKQATFADESELKADLMR